LCFLADTGEAGTTNNCGGAIDKSSGCSLRERLNSWSARKHKEPSQIVETRQRSLSDSQTDRPVSLELLTSSQQLDKKRDTEKSRKKMWRRSDTNIYSEESSTNGSLFLPAHLSGLSASSMVEVTVKKKKHKRIDVESDSLPKTKSLQEQDITKNKLRKSMLQTSLDSKLNEKAKKQKKGEEKGKQTFQMRIKGSKIIRRIKAPKDLLELKCMLGGIKKKCVVKRNIEFHKFLGVVGKVHSVTCNCFMYKLAGTKLLVNDKEAFLEFMERSKAEESRKIWLRCEN